MGHGVAIAYGENRKGIDVQTVKSSPFRVSPPGRLFWSIN